MTAKRLPLPLLLLALVALLAPAAAQAAYAPKLAVELDTTQRQATPALTTRITQAPGETATKSVRMTFPAGYEVNTPDVASCPAADEERRACPEASRIGAAQAVASGMEVSGPIHISTDGGQLRIIVFLDGFGGLIQQKLTGRVEFGDDARMTAVFDDVPNLSTTSVTLSFLGGTKSLVRNPSACGEAVFSAAFTSHQDEQATSQAAVTITGCGGAGGDDAQHGERPVISRVSVSPRRARTGGRVTVKWTLSEATGGTELRLERRAGRRWRRAGTVDAGGRKGANRRTVSLRRMRPGRYRVTVLTENEHGLEAKVRRAYFTVLARRG